ncbi:MAG: hypothetical protein AAB530_00505 [Patescibacteria group bacterium]
MDKAFEEKPTHDQTIADTNIPRGGKPGKGEKTIDLFYEDGDNAFGSLETPIYNDSEIGNKEFNEWINQELSPLTAEEVEKIEDEFKVYKPLATVIAYAKNKPGVWFETSNWVHFTNSKENVDEHYNWDHLADHGLEIGEKNGYLCVRWPKKNKLPKIH